MKMLRVGILILGLLISAVFPAYSQGGVTAVGMVTQITGQVFIQRGQAKNEAKLAELLYPGDTLVTTGAGVASIMYCPTSEKLVLGKSVTLELGAKDIKVVKGAAPARSAARCMLPRVALGSESLERMGAFRARGLKPVVQYLGGPISGERPTFEWAAVEGAKSYRLRLKDADEDKLLWESRPSSPMVAYPASEPALQPGKAYEWEILAEANGEQLAQSSVSFEVKKNGEAAAKQDDDLMQGLELESKGYFAEAGAYFRKIRKASPEDTRITRHLAWLYWSAGLLEAFKQEWNSLTDK